MDQRAILILADDRHVEPARSLSRAVRDRWSIGAPPEVRVLGTSGNGTTAIGSADALLVLAGERVSADEERTMLLTVATARDEEMPVLVIGDIGAPSGPGIAMLPAGAEPGTIAAVLAGMLLRQPRIDELRTEREATARVAGTVHDKMTRIDEELQAAGIVQRNFLPGRLPKIGSIDVGALWRPTSYVSGDYYDVRRIDRRTIGVFIVDAAGHGVPSALMTMVLARAFDWAQTTHPHRPDLVMRTLNDELCFQQTGITRFATGAYALVDCIDGSISYCSAGHPPPLRLDGNSLRPFPNTRAGGLLGVFPEQEFHVMRERISPGETLLLHSDGFEQAFPLADASPDELTVPSDAYLDVFESLGELEDAESMVSSISRTIDRRRGSLHPCDDLTLLCVHRMREAGSARNAA